MNEFATYHTAAIVLFQEHIELEGHNAFDQARLEGHRICPMVIPAPDNENHQNSEDRYIKIKSLSDKVKVLGGLLFISGTDVRTDIQHIIRLTSAKTIYWNKTEQSAQKSKNDRLRLYLGAAGLETRIISPNPYERSQPAAMSMAGNYLLNDSPEPPKLMFWQPSPASSKTLIQSLTSLDNARQNEDEK